MSVDKLVDSTQLDADLTSVANAIRTKGGTSAQLAFPAEFVSAIEDIETGGGGDSGTIESDFINLEYAIVTVGVNTVSVATQVIPYLLGLAGFATTNYSCGWFGVVEHSSYVNNQAICMDAPTINQSIQKFYRYRNGAASSANLGNSYDAVLPVGSKYLISCLRWKGAPT